MGFSQPDKGTPRVDRTLATDQPFVKKNTTAAIMTPKFNNIDRTIDRYDKI